MFGDTLVPLSMGRQKMRLYTNSLMYFFYIFTSLLLTSLIHPGSLPGIAAIVLAVAAIVLAVIVPVPIITVPVVTVVPVVTGTVVPVAIATVATIVLVAVLSHLLAHLTLHQGPSHLHPFDVPAKPDAKHDDEQNGKFHLPLL